MHNKKTIIVVGAAGAIGKKIADGFETPEVLVIRTTSSVRAGYVPLDLRSEESITNFANQVNSVSHLIIAAGKEPQKSLKELDLEHLNEMIDVHYKGPLWLIKQLQNKFTEDSTITLISSVAANKGSYDPSYASLKSAVNGLVRTLAREFAPHTRVNAIAPGLVMDTPVYHRMSSDFLDRHLKGTLNNCLLSASDIADMIRVIGEQRSINGQIIHLNGGQYFGQ